MAFPATTARYLIFVLNLVFLVSAIAVAVIAILIEVAFLNHDLFITQDWTSPPIIIAIACGVIFLVSLFGCCGVIRESRCCLILFSILLFVVVVGEIVAGIYVYSTKDVIATGIQKEMNQTLVKYNTDEIAKRSWDALQHDFKCCGVMNATDWNRYSPPGAPLPGSCCLDLPVRDTCTFAKSTKIGCYSSFVQFIQTKSLTLAGIAVSVGIVQMLCAIASGFLARHINRQYEAVV